MSYIVYYWKAID